MAEYANLKAKIDAGVFRFDLAHGDYHNHTQYSDGLDTPAEVVARAVRLGLSEIAITDHDGIGGLREARLAGEACGLSVVPGIELSTRMADGTGLHILGYGIDIDDAALNTRLEAILAARTDRNDRLIAALQKGGYEVTKEEIADRPGQTYIGKPNIARVLIRKGYARTMEEVFRDIFGREPYKAIKKEPLDPAEGVRMILAAGGLPVWAHPGKTKRIGEIGSEEYYGNVERILDYLTENGIAGLECYYPKHTAEMAERFCAMAKARGLVITCGSDYHGD